MNIRKKTNEICLPLEIEDYVVQPYSEVSPPKWHLGHTTWFLEELILNKFTENYEFYNRGWRKIYNSYYKGLGEHWVQAERGYLSRPTVKEVYKYREVIEEQVCELLKQNHNPDLLRMVEIANNHEEQHQELLWMDIKSILSVNPNTVAYTNDFPRPFIKENSEWIQIPSGLYEIGMNKFGFAYDNEGPAHQIYLNAYSIASSLVTNREYLSFINDGGYKEPRWWLSMGIDWVNKNKVKAPLYWSNDDGEWWEYTLFGKNKLDLNAPVGHVSYFEADAFARWRGKRLPTEEEFEVAQNDNRTRDLWSWTKSSYEPYPGFKPFPGKLAEYNGKFMCNQYVLKGGCFATPEGHYRKSYRNFFEPHQRWMFSGITLAEDR